jgi:pyroglutamyl-peptidase
MRILLTGFEPFDSSPINPSQQAVQRLANCPPAGIELHTAILPVDHRRGPEELLRGLDLSRPEAVVCLGESGNLGLSLERVAINLIDDPIPDNAGELWVDRPVVTGGPAAYFTTLPVRAMLQAILEAGVPAELSLTAGTFLCNRIAYTLLHYLSIGRGPEVIPAGFIHLPKLPEQAAAIKLAHPKTSLRPTMSLEVRGLEAGLKVLIK